LRVSSGGKVPLGLRVEFIDIEVSDEVVNLLLIPVPNDFVAHSDDVFDFVVDFSVVGLEFPERRMDEVIAMVLPILCLQVPVG
jgi:hypothetical protein